METFDKLSCRMHMVVDMLTKGKSVADIGCDHAFVSIYLLKHNISPKVIAMDVKKGPLEIASKNVNTYLKEQSSKVEIRLSNGFSKLLEGETEAAVIAGMGGPLIIKILEQGKAIITEGYELILQPQSEIKSVREYLRNNNFKILEEKMVLEEGKYYTAIKTIKTVNLVKNEEAINVEETINAEEAVNAKKSVENNGYDIYANQEVFDTYGEQLILNRSNVLKEFLLKEIQTKEDIICSLKGFGENERSLRRCEELEHDIDIAKKALKLMENN